MTLSERLRDMVQKLRRTPTPIADVAPLLTEAADALDLAGRKPVAWVLTNRFGDVYHFALADGDDVQPVLFV